MVEAAAPQRLHCRRIGVGPDLVVLHGWGLHCGVWEPVLQSLAECFRLHLYDLPGHGHSDAVDAPGLEQVCECLARDAPERAAWLGWSLGGTVALQFALLYPQRVTRLALAASSPKFVAASDWPHAMQPETLAQFARALHADYAGTLNRFLALVARGAPDHAVLRTLRDSVRSAPAPTLAGLQVGLEILRSTDLRMHIDALHMPTLLLAGARDTLVPVSAQRELSRLFPQVRLREFAQAGHAPFISHAHEFVAALMAFLA